VLHSYVEDRGFYEDATYHNPSWGGATGALTSNVHDLGSSGHVFGALISPASLREITAPSSVGKGGNRPDLYFAYGFVYANGRLVQNPDMNGYNGGFAYTPTNGVMLIVAATKLPNPANDPPAIRNCSWAGELAPPDRQPRFRLHGTIRLPRRDTDCLLSTLLMTSSPRC